MPLPIIQRQKSNYRRKDKVYWFHPPRPFDPPWTNDIQLYSRISKPAYIHSRVYSIIKGWFSKYALFRYYLQRVRWSNFRISQFLLLSKKEIIGKDKEYFKLNKLIEDVLNFLYPSILDSKVKIKNDLREDLTLIGYSDEIRQVFINIIFNAIDVLNHHRHSQPTISISSSVEDQQFVKVTISNNGPMIPAELQRPFWTFLYH